MVPTNALATVRIACTGVFAAVLATAGAEAAELSREQIEHSQNVENCDVHGPGYVRVEGTEACARIGSRLRVPMELSRPPRLSGAPTPFESEPGFDVPMGDGPSRAHLRLESPAGPSMRAISR